MLEIKVSEQINKKRVNDSTLSFTLLKVEEKGKNQFF